MFSKHKVEPITTPKASERCVARTRLDRARHSSVSERSVSQCLIISPLRVHSLVACKVYTQQANPFSIKITQSAHRDLSVGAQHADSYGRGVAQVAATETKLICVRTVLALLPLSKRSHTEGNCAKQRTRTHCSEMRVVKVKLLH